MTLTRKQTAWKKSRKFGDVKGGRMRPKLTDNIFNRQHNLQAPTDTQETPVYIQDNPSRDFYFPVSIEEIKDFLEKLPREHTEHLTHIWLRKMKKKEYEKEGCFICGRGINLIVIYPFPKNLKMNYGKNKPAKKKLSWYSAYKPAIKQKGENWYLQWTKESIKQYYLESLLLHEIGHKMDSVHKRYWSQAYAQKAEQFANNYAFYWGDKIRNNFS